MVLLNPLAAPFTPSEGLAPPPPWPALSCSSLSPSLPSYTLHDLILAVLTAYKQGLFDAHIASPSQSYTNSSPPTLVTPSNDHSSLSSPSVADSGPGSASTFPHDHRYPSPSLQKRDVPPTAVSTAAIIDNPIPPTISTPLDYSCLIDSFSVGKSGYPLVVPSKSRRSSSTRPTVKPCISSGIIRQHNRKPSRRSMKSRSETPKNTTITLPTRPDPSIPSRPITRPSSPSPIPTHNRFDTIAIPEEENHTGFALALLQPLINQAINDAETKSVVQSVLTDICDRVVSNVVVTVDTPSIHPSPSSITTKKQKKSKKKSKQVSLVASSSIASSQTTDIPSSPSLAAVPSLVDTNLASISIPIDSNINVAERSSTIVEEQAEVEMKENPIITSAQPLSSSQAKKLKKQNKMVKKEVVDNRMRNKTRAARRMKKQEKEFEGLSFEESGEKLREILAACAGKKGRRLDDDIDEVWYDPSCDIAEEDLMEFGNRW